MQAALTATERAIIKADVANEKRFDSVNEFRQTLSDQATQFVTNAEFAVATTAMNQRLEDIKTRLDKQEGKGAGLNAGWLYLLGVVAALGTIVSFIVLLI